jgi:hypothetical protein
MVRRLNRAFGERFDARVQGSGSATARNQSRQRRMEPLWSPAVATGGNQWQMEQRQTRLR